MKENKGWTNQQVEASDRSEGGGHGSRREREGANSTHKNERYGLHTEL